GIKLSLRCTFIGDGNLLTEVRSNHSAGNVSELVSKGDCFRIDLHDGSVYGISRESFSLREKVGHQDMQRRMRDVRTCRSLTCPFERVQKLFVVQCSMAICHFRMRL